jgi:putative heme-binding domain-containing protein
MSFRLSARLKIAEPVVKWAHPLATLLLVSWLHLAVGGAGNLQAADDLFAAGVRVTDPVTPEAQVSAFVVPPGFEMQLVASEPDIHKPMNMAFDARGRLWVTTSVEYPYPAPPDRAGRDRLMVFEDFGADGKAGKVTQFADGLNIPIGVYPFETIDGQGQIVTRVVVWSIPHIWIMEDTTGDLIADKRTRLYGPFDHTRDTHGNQASFRRGFDGWLYATHGFNNQSRVQGRDGHQVEMHSGNTYRMRLDGSRLEHHTWGQVNPFGASWDPWGNLYTSDCHSAPIYQLIPGGYYPSFGKPHDGLGFAPTLMDHAHGSTAIDGLTFLADGLWGDTFEDNIVIGNVMTSRINRDRLTWNGSTPVAHELPDLVTTTDPWFRPVDTTLGPDGALYIADFYNRIIGHYEVPLDHPGRDRERGRIWRLKPTDKTLRSPTLPDTVAELLGELGSESLTRRLLAMHALMDRHGATIAPEVLNAWNDSESATLDVSRSFRRAHLIWLLSRLNVLTEERLMSAVHDVQPLVRAHALRVVGQQAQPTHAPQQRADAAQSSTSTLSLDALRGLAGVGLMDEDPRVQRAAVEAVGYLPHPRFIEVLINRLEHIPADDTHLVYATRKALRDHVLDETVAAYLLNREWSLSQQVRLADVLLAVQRPVAGTFLIRHLNTLEAAGVNMRNTLRHAARFAPESDSERMVKFVEERFLNQPGFQLDLFQGIQQGVQQRGEDVSPTVGSWGLRLLSQLLADADPTRSWRNIPSELQPTPNPWIYEQRAFADGTTGRVLSSFPRGEGLTGSLRSPTFDAPESVEFWLCGHDGPPDKPALGRNSVRLYSAETLEPLRQARPPRNDVAQRIEWDLSRWKGQRVFLEITDEDTGGAYAWLAIGRLKAEGLELPDLAPADKARHLVAACEMIESLAVSVDQLPTSVITNLRRIVLQSGDAGLRLAAAKAWAISQPVERVSRELGWLVLDGGEDPAVREGLAAVLCDRDAETGGEVVLQSILDAPARLQQAFTLTMARRSVTAEMLLAGVETDVVPARLLHDRRVQDSLRAVNVENIGQRLERILQSITDPVPSRDDVIQDRRRAYLAGQSDPIQGRKVYELNCLNCHQLDGEGGLIGPQLTGIGNRGLERLLEDVLDPNRNVDHAFRVTMMTLKDGQILSGLLRREEGALLILANSAGQEIQIEKANVEEMEEIEASLMPDNFSEILDAQSLNDLMAYLLAQRVTSP